MRYPGRVTMCVSSQAGCGMNCPFCATGQAGLTRNMSAAEIVDQVVAGARMLRDGRDRRRPRPGQQRRVHGDGRGAGELQGGRAGDPRPGGPGARRPRPVRAEPHDVAPSGWCRRCGSSPARALPVTLAVSLHAPDDELRDTLVPINTRWKVAEVLDAARHYFEVTGRRVSIEYALIRDINDQAWRADLLGDRAQPARPRLGARQPDPAEPDTGLEVDGQRSRGRAHLRRAAARARHPHHRPRHPGPRDRRRLRPAGSGDRVRHR